MLRVVFTYSFVSDLLLLNRMPGSLVHPLIAQHSQCSECHESKNLTALEFDELDL